MLSEISFSARPGQTVAVIGSTGAGKSTLVNLVPRLFDATSGVVSVGGSDVRQVDPDALWAQIGLVPQRAYLFSGTVRSNLLHGKPDATEDELWQALEIAQARDFVEAMADGLDAAGDPGRHQLLRRPAPAARHRAGVGTPTGDLPVRRLVLGARPRHRRAAAGRPAPDHDRDATTVIVAQRVTTIIDADLILVLEDGRIVGRGTHQELLETCTTYQEIVDLADDRGGGGMSENSTAQGSSPGRNCRGQGQAGRVRGHRADRGTPGRSRPRPDGRRHGRPEGDDVRPLRQAPRGPDATGPRKAIAVVVLGVASVALMSVGPRILGHATDLVFSGLFSRDIPSGQTQAEAVAACGSRARTSSPTCSPGWTTSSRARASTSPRSATCCCSCSRCTPPPPCSAGCRAWCSTGSCRTPSTGCGRTSRTRSTGCR